MVKTWSFADNFKCIVDCILENIYADKDLSTCWLDNGMRGSKRVEQCKFF